MAGSPIFSVNFTNRRNSAILNYHKSWSWSKQPVLWYFYIMFLFVSSLWMFVTIFCPKHGVTGDVWRHNILTFYAASAENRREKSPCVSSLLELSLFHHNVDKIMLKCISAPEGNYKRVETLIRITTYDSSERLNFFDLWNLLRIWDCRPFSVLKTLTGSRAEKSSKCHKTRFRLLSPA